MKLLTVAGPLDRLDEIAAACIIDQEIHLESALRLLQNISGLRPLQGGNPYTALLRRVEELTVRLKIPLSRKDDGKMWTTEELAAYFASLEGRAAELAKEREAQLQLADQNRNIIAELERLRGVSSDLNDLWDMTFARFRYGYLPRETYDSFLQALQRREDVYFFPTNVEDKRVYGVYFTTKSSHEKVDTLFNSLHFVRVRIEASPAGSVEAAVADMTAQSQAADREAERLQSDLDAMKDSEQEKLLDAFTYLRFHKECCDVRRYAACSRETFYLTGWVPQTEVQALTEKLKAVGGLSYVLDEGTHIPLSTPPTKLRHGLLGRIFQPFLELYGLPAYHETDPTAFMALTYCLFFGIMFGDVGQGLGLALIGLLAWRKKGAWLGRIITCCGLSGAAFGFVYGSVFGFEDVLPGFKVLEGNHVLTLLLLSVFLGILMLLVAMAINIINGVRQRNYEKILFGRNGAAGVMFYGGTVLMVALTASGTANLMTPGYILPVIVLPLALILLREPLSRLLSGDPEWKHIRLGELLGLGFFELFETLLSYLTNTLSFLRMGAYAVIHVGLMLVVQMLAGSGSIVVLVLGNLFVMGFEGFLVGIQVLRLEFYELFSRFYDGGGIPYKPSRINYSTRSVI
jgi:V/A-type H+-transporting ATPase subunit I